jgi:hypothetical protein
MRKTQAPVLETAPNRHSRAVSTDERSLHAGNRIEQAELAAPGRAPKKIFESGNARLPAFPGAPEHPSRDRGRNEFARRLGIVRFQRSVEATHRLLRRTLVIALAAGCDTQASERQERRAYALRVHATSVAISATATGTGHAD